MQVNKNSMTRKSRSFCFNVYGKIILSTIKYQTDRLARDSGSKNQNASQIINSLSKLISFLMCSKNVYSVFIHIL